MRSKTLKSAGKSPILQFSIYVANRMGRLNDILGLLYAQGIHVIALCSLDATDCAIIRLVIDDVEKGRQLFLDKNIPFHEMQVVGVELHNTEQLKSITCALLQAEINIHYLYPFFMRPNGNSGVIISLEDNELAGEILRKHHFHVLTQSDITR